MARTVDDFIIDFSKQDDEGGGGGFHYSPGHYKVKVLAAKTGTSENKNTPYWELNLLFVDGKYGKAKKKIRERLYISRKAMRRFRILFAALDISPPKKPMNSSDEFVAYLNRLAVKIKGKLLWIELDDEPPREGYDTPRSRVTFEGFFPEDYDPEDEEDEEADEDDEEEDEDLEEDEDEDEDDEEEEEEPAPKRKAKAKPKAAPKKSTRKAKVKADDDEDEDDDLDDLDLDAM